MHRTVRLMTLATLGFVVFAGGCVEPRYVPVDTGLTYREVPRVSRPLTWAPLLLSLADLDVLPQDVDTFIFDATRGDVFVRVVLRNIGALASPAVDVHVSVQVTHMGTTQPAGGFPQTVSFPALSPGATGYRDFGAIRVQPGTSRLDVYVVADPPTQTNPGGKVWESREDNNAELLSVTVMR